MFDPLPGAAAAGLYYFKLKKFLREKSGAIHIMVTFPWHNS